MVTLPASLSPLATVDRLQPKELFESVGFFFWRIGLSLGQDRLIASLTALAAIVLLVYLFGWVIRGFVNMRLNANSTPRPMPPPEGADGRTLLTRTAKVGAGLLLVAVMLVTRTVLVAHLTELPPDEVSKLNGNGAVYYDEFDGKLYNGSAWVVNELTIQVTAAEKDKSVRWSREYKTSGLWVPPLETRPFRIDLSGASDNPTFDWSIVSAQGRKP